MINKLQKDEFIDIVKKQSYKHEDEVEALSFGRKNVYDVYLKSNHEFAKYYTIVFDKKVMVTIMLQRCGGLVYFVTNNFTSDYTLKVISDVKYLADTTIEKVDNIITRTAKNYTAANRFNKIIGFVPYKIEHYFVTWVYGK